MKKKYLKKSDNLKKNERETTNIVQISKRSQKYANYLRLLLYADCCIVFLWYWEIVVFAVQWDAVR